MSAFIVPDAHINALVTWAGRTDVSYHHNNKGQRVSGREPEVAALLYAANVRSVNARYSGATPEDGFVFESEDRRRSALEILRACDCFDYQSCESEDYDASEAAAVIRSVRAFAVVKLPGYDSADWVIQS